MSKRFSIFATLFILAAIYAVPAMAQFGAIEGDIKDADGKPVVGAQIVIDRTDMKGHWETTVKDKKGHYYYGGLPLGLMKVTLKIDGKEVDSVSGVKIGLGDPIKVPFDLKQLELRKAAAQAGIQIPEKPNLSGSGAGAAPQISKEEMSKIEAAKTKRDEAVKKQNALQTSFNAGIEALKNKQCDEAVTDFNTAAVNDPSQSAVFANLGEAYNCASKTKSGDERKDALAKADDAYQKAIALKPDDGPIHHNLGLVMVGEGKTAEGMAELNKAAQLDPQNAGKYYFNLGAILTNAGKIDEAAQAFQNAVKADPNYAEAYFQLGTALMGKATLDPKTGKIAPAPGTIESFQKYLDVAPNGPNAGTAKSMIETLGGKVEVEVKQKSDKNAVKKKP